MKKPKNWEGIKWSLVGAPVRPSECTVNLFEIVEYASVLEQAVEEAKDIAGQKDFASIGIRMREWHEKWWKGG